MLSPDPACDFPTSSSPTRAQHSCRRWSEKPGLSGVPCHYAVACKTLPGWCINFHCFFENEHSTCGILNVFLHIFTVQANSSKHPNQYGWRNGITALWMIFGTHSFNLTPDIPQNVNLLEAILTVTNGFNYPMTQQSPGAWMFRYVWTYWMDLYQLQAGPQLTFFLKMWPQMSLSPSTLSSTLATKGVSWIRSLIDDLCLLILKNKHVRVKETSLEISLAWLCTPSSFSKTGRIFLPLTSLVKHTSNRNSIPFSESCLFVLSGQ